MKLFRLPDLGEGLPDAEIREWYINVGDEVIVDQPLVAMETAKALVDVPAPFAGKIAKLFGNVGTTIHTGGPLIGFEGDDEQPSARQDQGTVVGNIEVNNDVLTHDALNIQKSSKRVASPSVRALARRLDVDLTTLPTENGRILAKHVKMAAHTGTHTPAQAGFAKMSAMRRAMALSMARSHREVVPVCLTEDVDIRAWHGKDNITIRIIRAITAACAAEPMLNATFNGRRMTYRLNQEVSIALAVDTPHGLYVPVLKDIAHQSDEDLRQKINQFKAQAQTKSIAQADQQGGTIMLSNFGSIAGRYATPILLPPMVAILGVGKLRDTVLPLSLTIDHRAITGGEAARFLQALLQKLE